MLGRRWLAIWVHSNSLIKNLNSFWRWCRNLFTPFSNVWKQPEDTFIKMASLKIDFYFEVFKQLKIMFWVISQKQHSIKTLKFTKPDTYFYSFTCEKKNNLAVSSSYHQRVDFFCQFVGRQISCGFNTKIFSAYLRYKPGFYFFSLYKIQMSKQHRLINLTISYQTD